MALLIPDSLRSRKDVPATVRRVAGALGTALDDDVTIWYEPMFDHEGSRPDLVVLDPRSGVTVIEVLKGSGKTQLLGAIDGQLRVATDGKEVAIPSPLVRADAFASALRSAIHNNKLLAHVPVGALTAFTGLTRSAAHERRVGEVVDLDRSLFKEELDTASMNSDPAAVLRAFARASGKGTSASRRA